MTTHQCTKLLISKLTHTSRTLSLILIEHLISLVQNFDFFMVRPLSPKAFISIGYAHTKNIPVNLGGAPKAVRVPARAHFAVASISLPPAA